MPDGANYPWPRLMRAERAAAYLDVSKSTFLARIAPELRPVRLTAGIVGYLRDDLDRWLDAQAARGAASAEPEANPWHK